MERLYEWYFTILIAHGLNGENRLSSRIILTIAEWGYIVIHKLIQIKKKFRTKLTLLSMAIKTPKTEVDFYGFLYYFIDNVYLDFFRNEPKRKVELKEVKLILSSLINPNEDMDHSYSYYRKQMDGLIAIEKAKNNKKDLDFVTLQVLANKLKYARKAAQKKRTALRKERQDRLFYLINKNHEYWRI